MSSKKEIDWALIDNMLIAGCIGTECAAAVGVHPETLYDRCRLDKSTGWSEYLQAKRSHGDGLLRAAQYKKAYNDQNPTMLIWLGKQRLDQKENYDSVVSNDNQLTKALELIKSNDVETIKKENEELKKKILYLENQSAAEPYESNSP